MDYTLSQLELADWQVALCSRHVALQKSIVQGLSESGRDTTQAKVVLATLEETLKAHRARRDLIREGLEAQRDGAAHPDDPGLEVKREDFRQPHRK